MENKTLRELRLEKGLWQKDVASALGVSAQYYAQVERGIKESHALELRARRFLKKCKEGNRYTPLVRARMKAGISQREMAAKLGICESYYRQIEKGRKCQPEIKQRAWKILFLEEVSANER